MLNRFIRYFLYRRIFAILLLSAIIIVGLMVSPFQWVNSILPKTPIPVDAIPNVGANQQIVFTKWAGHYPEDIDNQITYPLTTYLLGLPKVKTVRSTSMFGYCSIYIIFEDGVDTYWSRSRILEKLNAIPSGLLPSDTKPTLGPDASALGQIFWYTLEPRDDNNKPTGGWSLEEIRRTQDFYVKYVLSSTKGIAEVSSIGGYVKEYQIDVNPDALLYHNLSLSQIVESIQKNNNEISAGTVEINMVEYLVRGLGYIQNVQDLENIVVKEIDHTPIYLKDVAHILVGPKKRRGVLDKEGAEVVGGVVVSRDGYNPLEAIKHIKEKIKEISPGLPTKTLEDGTRSQLKIVPFYDRSSLIQESIQTLEDAISLQLVIALLVIIVMVFNLRASVVISSVLPISVLLVFIVMSICQIQANIVALSGIAIAIGTMIDLAIILVENVLKKVDSKSNNNLLTQIYNGCSEVSGAILTAILTTIISFIPVFALEDAEGKLFTPLAYTKTFALISAFIISIIILPTLFYFVFTLKIQKKRTALILNTVLLVLGLIIIFYSFWYGLFVIVYSLGFFAHKYDFLGYFKLQHIQTYILLAGIISILTSYWLPLGYLQSFYSNLFFVLAIIGFILLFFYAILKYYTNILKFFIKRYKTLLAVNFSILLFATIIWLGIPKVLYWPNVWLSQINLPIENTIFWKKSQQYFPGIGKEFMPSLNEGSFIYMPTSMAHSGIEFNKDKLKQLDMAVKSIPEVETVVGKLGRVESAIDPAPISMFENLITYKSEFIQNKNGKPRLFTINNKGNYKLVGIKVGNESIQISGNKEDYLWFDTHQYSFLNKENQLYNNSIQQKLFYELDNDFSYFLEQNKSGKPFRNWRKHIKSPDDIWNEILKVTTMPGVTSAPKLQPIETRQIMLQTGMRASMGIKVSGPSLPIIDSFSKQLEQILLKVPSLKKESIFTESIVAKPYINIKIKPSMVRKYGLSTKEIQDFITTAVGGRKASTIIKDREYYDVRVRYPRENRNTPTDIKRMLFTTKSGTPIPLGDLVDIEYSKGPQSIKREDTFLNSVVIFDKKNNISEIDAVNLAKKSILNHIHSGNLIIPQGVSYRFAGNFENQVRSEKRLSFIIPLVLIAIFFILYFQFNSTKISALVFTSNALAFSGGFILIWLYGQEWFLDIHWFSHSVREIFQVKTIHLSVAVWVGFIALFGIATDDAVLMATYLNQNVKNKIFSSKKDLQDAVINGGAKRIRPAIMTSITTIIALLPVLTSSGKGADIMIPMAIPIYGGMLLVCLNYFMLPILFYKMQLKQLKKN